MANPTTPAEREALRKALTYCRDNITLSVDLVADLLSDLAAAEAQIAAAKREGMDLGLVWAAKIASNACLVLPDGGSPTEEEAAMCDEAKARILRCVGDVPDAIDGMWFAQQIGAIRAASGGRDGER